LRVEDTIACASRFMTELSPNVFIAAGQQLLGESERAFVAACDTVCVIAEAADGWPSVRVSDRAAAALEVVNSQALRLRVDQTIVTLIHGQKLALLLIRLSDGQHLIIHGRVVAQTGEGEGEPRLRIAVASCSWSPELGLDASAPIARALSRA